MLISMSNLSLRNKLLLLALLPLVIILTAVMAYSWRLESAALTDAVGLFRDKLVNERKQQLKEATEIALATIDYQLKLGDAGNVNESLRVQRFWHGGVFLHLRLQRHQPFPCHQAVPGRNRSDWHD